MQLDQLVEKGTKKSSGNLGNDSASEQFAAEQAAAYNSAVAQAALGTSEGGNHPIYFTLPMSRPGADNTPSTVHEIYADALHPFTKFVRDIHNGIPMGITEFVPNCNKEVSPPKPPVGSLNEEPRAVPYPDQRVSAEEMRVNEERCMYVGANPNEYQVDAMQQQLKASIHDMQQHAAQRPAQMMDPNYEHETRNGPVQIPQQIFQNAPASHVQMGNGLIPMQPGQHMHPISNGHPVPIYNRPPQYGVAPMNLFTEQMQNNQQQEFTPQQVLAYLAPDIQVLVSNSVVGPEFVGRPEIMKCLNGKCILN